MERWFVAPNFFYSFHEFNSPVNGMSYYAHGEYSEKKVAFLKAKGFKQNPSYTFSIEGNEYIGLTSKNETFTAYLITPLI